MIYIFKRGITSMSRIKIPFTKEQQEILKNNPFTLSVNDYQIRFTIEFKKYLLAEREKNGTPWKQVFIKAGYAPEIIGESRLQAIVKNIRKEAASAKGLHETTSQKSRELKLEDKKTKKAIRELQEEVIQLQQQIEFLKKIQMLNMLDENEK